MITGMTGFKDVLINSLVSLARDYRKHDNLILLIWRDIGGHVYFYINLITHATVHCFYHL